MSRLTLTAEDRRVQQMLVASEVQAYGQDDARGLTVALLVVGAAVAAFLAGLVVGITW